MIGVGFLGILLSKSGEVEEARLSINRFLPCQAKENVQALARSDKESKPKSTSNTGQTVHNAP